VDFVKLVTQLAWVYYFDLEKNYKKKD